MNETSEEKFLTDVLARDDRPPEQLSEEERLKRFMNRKYVLEAVVPRPGMANLLGRCPGYYDDLAACRIQAREMFAEGKDITHVRIYDTRSWKVVHTEKR